MIKRELETGLAYSEGNKIWNVWNKDFWEEYKRANSWTRSLCPPPPTHFGTEIMAHDSEFS